MGLVTQLCFFVCFLGLIAAVGRDRKRFERALWAMANNGGGSGGLRLHAVFWLRPLPATGLLHDEFCRRACGPRHLDDRPFKLARQLSTLHGADKRGAWRSRQRASRAGLWPGPRFFQPPPLFSAGLAGAWLGLVAGGSTFAALMVGSRLSSLLRKPRRRILQTAAAIVVVLICRLGDELQPGLARNTRARARGCDRRVYRLGPDDALARFNQDGARPSPSSGAGRKGFARRFLLTSRESSPATRRR